MYQMDKDYAKTYAKLLPAGAIPPPQSQGSSGPSEGTSSPGKGKGSSEKTPQSPTSSTAPPPAYSPPSTGSRLSAWWRNKFRSSPPPDTKGKTPEETPSSDTEGKSSGKTPSDTNKEESLEV